jgi:Fe-S-cluster-containing dehydrogenase component
LTYGLLIDYEYCTGCHACEVACKQEYNHPPGQGGIKVIEVLEQLPGGKMYLAYIPFPTELCILCAPRMTQGDLPACVKHCMAGCMKFGDLEGLAKEASKKARQVLWVPRIIPKKGVDKNV